MHSSDRRLSSGHPPAENSPEISVLELELDFLLYVKNILSNRDLLDEAVFSRVSLEVDRGGKFEPSNLTDFEHYFEDLEKYEKEKQIHIDHDRLTLNINRKSYDSLIRLNLKNRAILDAAIMRALVKLTAIYQTHLDEIMDKASGAESTKYEKKFSEFQSYLRSQGGVLITKFVEDLDEEVKQNGISEEEFLDELQAFVEREINALKPMLLERYSPLPDLEKRAEDIENTYWDLAGLKREIKTEGNDDRESEDDEIEVNPNFAAAESSQPKDESKPKPSNTVDWKTIALIAGGVALGLAVVGGAIAAIVVTHGAALPVVAIAFGVAAKVALGTSIGATFASAIGITVVATGAGTAAAAVGGTAGYATSKMMDFFSRNRQDGTPPSPTMERRDSSSDLEHEERSTQAAPGKSKWYQFWKRKNNSDGVREQDHRPGQSHRFK